MKKIVDSSVWVALFLDFDTQHQKAKKCIMQLEGKILVPYAVISEVVTILTYKHSSEQALGFLSYIQNNTDIELMDNQLDEEILFFQKTQKNISFTDHALCPLDQIRWVHLQALCFITTNGISTGRPHPEPQAS